MSPENGYFYCFGCGAGGDVITFIMKIENLDYAEAVRFLAQKAGMDMPEDSYDDSMSRLRNRVYEANRAAARFYYSSLYSPVGAEGLNYLHGRALSDRTIRHFGLGFADDSWDSLCRHLHEKGFKDSELVAANLAVKKKDGSRVYDRFRNRVMFPIIDLRGNVIAFGGRIMTDEKPKYLNTSDTPVFKKSANLFSLNNAKNTGQRTLILCEGYMDVIAVNQAGFENAVATLGTALTSEQAMLMKRYADEVIICYDADEAGQKATARAIQILRNAGMLIRVLTIPNGKDPDEYIKANGPDRFKALLEGAVSDIEYKLLMAADGLDLNSDDGRLKYLSAAAEIIATTDDVMARDIYIGRLSDKYGVSRTALNARVDELRKKNARVRKKTEINEVIHPKFTKDDINPDRRKSVKGTSAEETVISILLSHPDFYNEARAKLSPDEMLTSLNRRIYEIICDTLNDGKSLDISVFAQKLLPAEVGYLVSLQNSNKGGNNPEAVLKDCIKVILEEKTLLNTDAVKDISVEDWAAQLQSIIDKKNKGN